MDAQSQFTAKEHVKIYSSFRRDAPKFLVERIISYLNEKYDGQLDLAVDVGCGSGQSSVALAPFFKRVHGMDIADAQIQEAKVSRTLPNITYEKSQAEAIPFDDGSVQLVNAGLALHWFHRDTFLPEARRVLCNNGVLSVYYYGSVKPLLENQTAAEDIDRLWDEIRDSTTRYRPLEVDIALDSYNDVAFPFEEIKHDEINEVFDGDLRDVTGYITSLSSFQNMKRHDDKKAVEILSYCEQRRSPLTLPHKGKPGTEDIFSHKTIQ